MAERDAKTDPSTPSLAHHALSSKWARIRTILDGADAIKAAGKRYLPKFPGEEEDEYSRRLESAPWRPEYEDALEAIVAKPFAKEVMLAGEPSDEVKAFAEDVDGLGNNLNVFARSVFSGGVGFGSKGILVESPPMPSLARTRAEERAAGARPYWVQIDAENVLEVRTERRGDRRAVVYLRFMEFDVTSDGFEQSAVRKIREIKAPGDDNGAGLDMAPGTWRVWHEAANASGKTEWTTEAEGIFTLPEVPFVLFVTGDLKGDQYVRPPLDNLAAMQIHIYRTESSEDEIYIAAGAPMLTANGMAPPGDNSSVQVGPHRVLYAPGAEGITPNWAYLQPAAENLKAITARVEGLVSAFRRLALQPLLPRTGNVTATATGVDAAKAHSRVQQWALQLKDALEQAFVFTAMWQGTNEADSAEVMVHTDFAVGVYGEAEINALLQARIDGQISQETFWDEMQRRDVLGPQFDKDAERERLEKEAPSFNTLLQDDPPA